MTWFKVDDGLAFHAKVVQAGNPAMGLWVRAGSWSAQQLTDGFVPDHIVTTLGNKAQAKRLAEVGLWHREGDGYRFHQWNEDGRQPTRAAVEKERAEARERMRKAREAKKEASGSGDVRANTERSSGDVRSTRPDPSRPDPSLEKNSSRGASHVSSGPTNEPPRCSQHKALRREDTPNCWACGHKREQWEMSLTTDAVFDRPPWCGDDACNPMTRQRETSLGVMRCPECHPLAEEAS